jgi:hypothetical protein
MHFNKHELLATSMQHYIQFLFDSLKRGGECHSDMTYDSDFLTGDPFDILFFLITYAILSKPFESVFAATDRFPDFRSPHIKHSHNREMVRIKPSIGSFAVGV